METAVVYRGYIEIMKNQGNYCSMLVLYRGYIGINENNVKITVYWYDLGVI